ncbi:unnamed protein product [Toxocara canis]|uniref:WD_REPEATS_REGION domain-containing protein n=1 Tax=Toxocara canis TaxID=6265 RepID=A0A183UYZ9_TOXCA|nr:unnamed protein product [Toxocara canis]
MTQLSNYGLLWISNVPPNEDEHGNFSVKLTAASTLVAHTKDVTCVDVSVNDRLCVTGSMDKTAKLWHIDPTKMQLGIAGTLVGHRRGVWDAKFSSSTQAVFVNNDKQLISADSGGLLKIWTVSAKECLSTVEAHDDKVWAMLAYSDETKFVTAGSDGRIRIWEDVTEKKREEEEQKRTQRVRDEQKLANLMQQKRYGEALSFSLTLSRPFNTSLSSKLYDLQASQQVLYEILHCYTPEQLLKTPNFAAIVESFIPYTNRSVLLIYYGLFCELPYTIKHKPTAIKSIHYLRSRITRVKSHLFEVLFA